MTSDASAYADTGARGAIVQSLGVAIVTGQYEPGTLIPTEERLAIEYGVSRPSVREAIRVLAGKGLLHSTAGRGTVIRPPEHWHLLDPDVLRWRYETVTTPSATDDLTGLRLFLEPSAARSAARNSSPRILDPIREALDRMAAAVDDTAAFVTADLDFHAAIVAATENQLLIHLDSMLAVALHAQRQVHTISKSRYSKTMPAHRRVYKAIASADPDTAETEARAIVERAHDDLLRYTGRAERSGRGTRLL